MEDWGEVGQLFASSGGGQPSRMERDFINPMRILELSMPPDEAEALQKARNMFEKAMQIIGKATAGIRRDLPVEVSQKGKSFFVTFVTDYAPSVCTNETETLESTFRDRNGKPGMGRWPSCSE